jgi:DNA-binding MarR family transcriptional regulator
MENAIRLIELFSQMSRKFGKALAPVFRKEELTRAEVSVLFGMNRRNSCRVTDLAAFIGLPASTLTGILDRLVAQEYLERHPDPDDRRSVIMTATPKLREFIRGMMAPVEMKLNEVLKAMPAKRIERLIDDLEYMLHIIEHTEPKNPEKKMA